MKFELTTSSMDSDRTNDPLGYLLGDDNKPQKYANRIISRRGKNGDWEHTIEINSLEELLELRVLCNCDIVICYHYEMPVLEINDTWRE